jgi:hypothetical protein
MTAPVGGQHPRLEPAALLFLCGVWVACHPWEGFTHDGVLYAAQALRHLHPEAFAGDPFFLGRSQDDFSVFGRAYAAIAAAAGLPAAALGLFVLGQGAWLAVSLRWIRAAAPGLALAGIACLLAMRFPYGPLRSLELAESFVTARLLAEPMVLAALLLASRRRGAAAAGVLAVALAVHPLVAAPAVGALAIGAAASRLGWARTAGLAVACLGALAVAAQALPPRIDGQWLELVKARTPAILPTGWGLELWARWALALLMLAIAAAVPTAHSALWRAVTLAGALGVAASLVALQSGWALLLQVQPWRAMWLATWFAPLAVCASALVLPREDSGLRLRLFVLLPAFAFAQQPWVPGASAASFACAVAVASTWRSTSGWFARDRADGAWFGAIVLCACAMAGAGLGMVGLAATGSAAAPADRSLGPFAAQLFGWAAAGALGWWAGHRGQPSAARSSRAAIAAVAALIAAVSLVDGRPPIARELARIQAGALDQWRAVVPPGSQVFWSGRHGYVWLGLERSSYVSDWQGAGSLFDRATAMEVERRLRAVRGADDGSGDGPGAREEGQSSRERFVPPAWRRLCAADPRIDFVVAADGEEGLGDHWVESFSQRSWRLHACGERR